MKSFAVARVVVWVVAAGLLAGAGAGCAVPHSAQVPRGAYAAVQAGGGAAKVQKEECQDCSATEEVSPVPSAQVTFGYGWRDREHPVLAYVTAPLITPVSIGRNAPDDSTEVALHVAASLALGASLGGYVELAGDGETSASGVGAMIDVATLIGTIGEGLDGDEYDDDEAYPAVQAYAMTGRRIGGAWVDAGVRGGVMPRGAVGGAAFAAARWGGGNGYRVGVWFDAAAATPLDLGWEEYDMVIPAVATAGVMVESW